MFIEAILLGIILGRFRSGNVKGLEKIKFKGLYFILGLLIFDIFLRFLMAKSQNPIFDTIFRIYPFISIIIYVITIFVININSRLKYMRVIEGGFILNLLPMVLNNGKMPVLESALIKIGKIEEVELMKKGLMFGHEIISESTRFWVFGDIIPFNLFIPKVISIGDIVIAAGIILFISHYMTRNRRIPKKV